MSKYCKSFYTGLSILCLSLFVVLNYGPAAAQMYSSSFQAYVSKEKHRGIGLNVVMKSDASKKQFDDLIKFIKAEIDATCPPPEGRRICDGIDAEQIRLNAVKFAQKNKIPYAYMNPRAPSMPKVA